MLEKSPPLGLDCVWLWIRLATIPFSQQHSITHWSCSDYASSLGGHPAPLIDRCEPTAHRFVFSARSSLSQRRPEPTAHRSGCDAPDRHRIAQLREGPRPVMTPSSISPESISGAKPGPGQQGGIRRAAVALGAERAADRHSLTRPMSVLIHLQRSDALSVT